MMYLQNFNQIKPFPYFWPAASLVEKLKLGQEVAIFRQTVANFRHGRHGCSNFTFAPKLPHNCVISSPKFCTFGRNFSSKKKIFRQTKIGGVAPCLLCHDVLFWHESFRDYTSLKYF